MSERQRRQEQMCMNGQMKLVPRQQAEALAGLCMLLRVQLDISEQIHSELLFFKQQDKGLSTKHRRSECLFILASGKRGKYRVSKSPRSLHMTAYTKRTQRYLSCFNMAMAVALDFPFSFFETESRSDCLGWNAMIRSQLIATSACRVQEILLPQPPERSDLLGLVAQACNPSTLGGRARQIMRSRDQDHPGQHGENPSLLKIQKLAGHGGVPSVTLLPGCSAVMQPWLNATWKSWAQTRSHAVAQVGLEIMGSSNSPTLASQSAEIIGMSHWAQPPFLYKFNINTYKMT
ncbi:Zinc finger protein 714 [Plecturocebus cupreus]